MINTENKNKIHSYKDLVVWQRAMELVVEIYNLTRRFPKEEVYGLTSQMKRAAVSIPSNIAEGRKRSSKKDFHQFAIIAFSSGAELETQVEISKRLQFCTDIDCLKVDSLLLEVMKMLNKLLSTLRS